MARDGAFYSTSTRVTAVVLKGTGWRMVHGPRDQETWVSGLVLPLTASPKQSPTTPPYPPTPSSRTVILQEGSKFYFIFFNIFIGV